MKLTGLVVAGAVLSLTLVSPPSPAGAQDSIRARYAQINRDLKRYTRVETDLMDESTEGGRLTAYYFKGAPRKLVARYYGETGRATEEYYFWNNSLFFVLRAEERYRNPIGVDSSPTVRSRQEDRYYFARGRLTRWVNPRGRQVPVDRVDARQRELEVLNDARRLLALARVARPRRA